MQPKILVIGESCKDVFIYGDCNRICPEGPVPVINPDHTKNYGGMALNVFENIKSLGADVKIITNKNWRKITKTRYVHSKTGQLLLRVDNNDDDYGGIKYGAIHSIDFEDYDAVVISDYNKGYLSEESIQFIIEQHPLTFMDTKKDLGEWCYGVTYLKINNEEYSRNIPFLFKDNEWFEKLIVTHGNKGCAYMGKSFPVSEVDVQATPGAGDTFLAALAVEYCTNKNIITAINFANTCATEVVQKRGISVATGPKNQTS